MCGVASAPGASSRDRANQNETWGSLISRSLGGEARPKSLYGPDRKGNGEPIGQRKREIRGERSGKRYEVPTHATCRLCGESIAKGGAGAPWVMVPSRSRIRFGKCPKSPTGVHQPRYGSRW